MRYLNVSPVNTRKLIFRGSLTQHAAEHHCGRFRATLGNPPRDGWEQLWGALNGASWMGRAIPGKLSQGLRFATDIAYDPCSN
jgi:hypothetical protein